MVGPISGADPYSRHQIGLTWNVNGWIYFTIGGDYIRVLTPTSLLIMYGFANSNTARYVASNTYWGVVWGLNYIYWDGVLIGTYSGYGLTHVVVGPYVYFKENSAGGIYYYISRELA